MKRLVKLAAIAAVVVGVVSALKRRPAPPSASPTAPPSRPGPVEAPAVPTEMAEAVGTPPTGWVEPADDGGCPEGYPVKAKASSKIFHVPGGVLYDKTVADRCYASPEVAEADGYRASLR